MSGLTAGQREVKERKTLSSVSQHGFLSFVFLARESRSVELETIYHGK